MSPAKTVSKPRVFISHGSLDKERFVTAFAAALRAAGIDAWYDQWEIRPGDSIVRKIFDDGIGRAEAIVVVVSATSVTRPWVREELDAAVMLRIGSRIRIIPVVLDDADVPVALMAAAWIKVSDPSAPGDAVRQIVDTLYGHVSKPPVGEPPIFAHDTAPSGMTVADATAMKAVGDLQVADDYPFASIGVVLNRLSATGMTAPSALESLDVLRATGYLHVEGYLEESQAMLRLTPFGMEEYLRFAVPAYAVLRPRIEAAVVNRSDVTARGLATELGCARVVVDHVFEDLDSLGLVKLARDLSDTGVWEVSALMRRRVAGARPIGTEE